MLIQSWLSWNKRKIREPDAGLKYFQKISSFMHLSKNAALCILQQKKIHLKMENNNKNRSTRARLWFKFLCGKERQVIEIFTSERKWNFVQFFSKNCVPKRSELRSIDFFQAAIQLFSGTMETIGNEKKKSINFVAKYLRAILVRVKNEIGPITTICIISLW